MAPRSIRYRPRNALLVLTVGAAAIAMSTAVLCRSGNAASEPRIIALPAMQPWIGDFDGMQERRLVRLLVPYSKTLFFQDKGNILGATAEAGFELEKWLNDRYGRKPYKWYVAFVPTRRDRLLDDLKSGRGDIAAANLTVTPERMVSVDFVSPWAHGVKEVLVTGAAAPKLDTVAELGGQSIHVRRSSSYYTHLLSMNAALTKAGNRPVIINVIDENLEDEDLLEMVSSGLLPWVIVDSHKAKLWSAIYDGLTVRDDIAINDGGEIAWAIRKQSPLLQHELNQFVTEQLKKPTVRDVWKRYFSTGKQIKNALASKDLETFKSLLAYFRLYGGRYSIDPYLLAAQGYKESRLNQKLRMKSGAVGVMQIKPSTARERAIGISDVVTRAEDNVHAGAKYLRFLADKYVADPNVDPMNQALMALAAYNAGPGNLAKFRRSAAEHGFDRNVWFGNVETGAAAVVGQETVRYVGEIYKYYIAYSALARPDDAANRSVQPP